MEPDVKPDFILSPENWLKAFVEWEKTPMANEVALEGLKEKIPRAEAYREIRKIRGFEERPLDIFNHAAGWQEARIAYLGQIQSSLEQGMDPAQLEELKRRLEEDKKDTATRQHKWNEFVEQKKGPDGEKVEEAKTVADTVNAAELKNVQEEPVTLPPIAGKVVQSEPSEQQTVPGSQASKKPHFIPNSEKGEDFRSLFKRITNNPIKALGDMFRVVRTNGPVESESEGGGVVIEPTTSTSGKAGGSGSATQRLVVSQGKKIAQDEIKNKVKGEIAKKVVTGAGEKVAATAVGGAATGGVGWVVGAALLLKDLFTSREMQEMLKDLAVKGLIFGSAVFWAVWNFISANLAGAIIGGALGLVGGPAGVLVGALTGAYIQSSLFGSAGIFGGGSATIATSSVAAGAGTATIGGVTVSAGAGAGAGGALAGVTTATISIGSFTIPVSVAALAGTWGSILLIPFVGGISVLLVTVLLAVGVIAITPPPEKTTTSDIDRTGELISVVSHVVQSAYPNGSTGQTISYSVTITSVGASDVSISVDTQESIQKGGQTTNIASPTYSFPISSSIVKGDSVTIPYDPYPITSAYDDSTLINTITVHAVSTTDSSKTQTQMDQILVSIGAPSYTGHCQLAPDGNQCSVANLLPHFDNDETKAENASRICYAESHGNQNAILTMCGGKYPKSYDVGLFQIGLFSHCTGGFVVGAPDACPQYQIPSVLQVCVTNYLDPTYNIQAAYNISKRGTDWHLWSTSKPTSAACPNCCGIQ